VIQNRVDELLILVLWLLLSANELPVMRPDISLAIVIVKPCVSLTLPADFSTGKGLSSAGVGRQWRSDAHGSEEGP